MKILLEATAAAQLSSLVGFVAATFGPTQYSTVFRVAPPPTDPIYRRKQESASLKAIHMKHYMAHTHLVLLKVVLGVI